MELVINLSVTKRPPPAYIAMLASSSLQASHIFKYMITKQIKYVNTLIIVCHREG